MNSMNVFALSIKSWLMIFVLSLVLWIIVKLVLMVKLNGVKFVIKGSSSKQMESVVNAQKDV